MRLAMIQTHSTRASSKSGERYAGKNKNWCFDEIRRECCLDALKKRIEERLRHKECCTILEHDLAHVWPRDERDQLKREKEIHAFAAAHGWIATILDPGIRVTFRKI
jgi:hypothetical protein